MIRDSLENCDYYDKISPKFNMAFKFLKEAKLDSIDCGIYKINGDDVFVSIVDYNTKRLEDALWEAHKKYIDIQYIIEGEEKMGYTNIKNIEITVNYNEDNDIEFGIASGDYFTLKKGEFVVFTTNDGHMPGLQVNESSRVKKAIIKVSI